MKQLPFLMTLLWPVAALASTSIPLTVNMSEAVTVTGTPRVAVDVGGTTRYATYTSGSGASALVFTLSPQAGDVDLDGITLTSPLDLNGGTLKDQAGNNATLTFTVPSTSGIKVNYPSLGMDFVVDADGRYTLNGTVYNDLSSFLTAAGGSFTRATIATYFDSTGVLQTVTAGTPRFDWDPVTHAAKGLLIEEPRTNAFTYAEQFDNAVWSKTAASVTANAQTAPSGAITGDKLVENAAISVHSLGYATNLSASVVRVVSVYVKAAERNWLRIQADDAAANIANANFDASSCAPGSTVGAGTYTVASSVQDVGGGWCRCQLIYSLGTATTRVILAMRTADGTGSSSYTGDGASGLYLWGAQVETGAMVSSYIPTTTVAVTRNGDQLIIPTGSWYGATEGTAFVEGQTTDTNTAHLPALFSLDDTTPNNRLQLRRVNSANLPHIAMVVGGTAVLANNGVTAWANANSHKLVYGMKPLAYKVYMDGITQLSSSSATALPSVTQLQLGYGANSAYLDAGLKQFKYYPLRLADTQLQLMTQ